jgi:Zn-dependent membrane protease YugP
MEASVAALGVAAHEAGHAVQDARNYRPMQIRSTLVPAASIGSQLWIFPAFIGLILGSTGLVNVGLVLFLAVVLFQLVTLPVEFDASHRAVVALEGGGLLAPRSSTGPQGPARRGPDLIARWRFDRPAHLLLRRSAVARRPWRGNERAARRT